MNLELPDVFHARQVGYRASRATYCDPETLCGYAKNLAGCSLEVLNMSGDNSVKLGYAQLWW